VRERNANGEVSTLVDEVLLQLVNLGLKILQTRFVLRYSKTKNG